MRIVVAAAMIDGLGRVLLQRRPEGKQHGGLWEFPGGKVEAGEGPVQALIREIDEELGVALSAADITPLSFAHADDRVARRRSAAAIRLPSVERGTGL
jgi:8-oxo-dGTP diphosphatase